MCIGITIRQLTINQYIYELSVQIGYIRSTINQI